MFSLIMKNNKHKYLSAFNLLFFLYVTLLLLSNIKSDIPVHCSSNDINGKWEIQISKEYFKPDLKYPKTTCGHQMPNKVDNNNSDNHIQNSNKVKIDFKQNDNNVYFNDKVIGHYSFVYDEAIILYIQNPLNLNLKSELFFHFRYYYSNDKFNSDCSRSLKGWFIKDIEDKSNNWACAFAHKSSASEIDKDHPDKHKQNNKLDTSFTQIKNLTQNKTLAKSYTLHPEHKYENTHGFVNYLNENQNSLWKAGINQSFIGITIKELYNKFHKKNRSKTKLEDFLTHKTYEPIENNSTLNNSMDFLQLKTTKLKKTRKANISNIESMKKFLHDSYDKKAKYIYDDSSVEKEKDSYFVKDYKTISKYLNTDLKDVDIQKLPKNWDWTNVGGVNYVPKVKEQSDCGSCYIMSSVSGLETRLRIKTNNSDKTKLSENYFLNKSFYTEGCEGGYPILIGKFGSEFGIAPEECTTKYSAKEDPNMRLCDYSNSKRRYFVSKADYLGGYYGNTTEVDMIKEIRSRGPILGNIRFPNSLSYYKSGIFTDDYDGGSNTGKWSVETMNDRGMLNQEVDHSTLIVGYGEENGYKYWKVLNSWGSDWGEEGFFKVLRGENIISIETMGDVLDIDYIDQ